MGFVERKMSVIDILIFMYFLVYEAGTNLIKTKVNVSADKMTEEVSIE